MKASPLLLFVCVFVAPTQWINAQQLTIIDDDMSSPDYSSFSFNNSGTSNPDDMSTEGKSAVATGGNPGGYLSVQHFHQIDSGVANSLAGPDGSTSVQSFFSNNPIDYTPSTQGGIQSITFSVDFRTSDPFSTLYFGVTDLNGGSFDGFTSITGDGEWQTITVTGLTNSGFGGRDFLGSDPLKFGFGFTTYADVSGGPETFTVDADNFKVVITQVPEPTVMALSILGVCGLVLRRRF